MNIVFLYTTIGHYMFATIKNICELNNQLSVFVIYDDNRGIDKNFNELELHDRVSFIAKSSVTDEKLFDFLVELQPGIIYFPSWQDKSYFKIVRKYRDGGYKSIQIGGFDDIWHGSIRQNLGALYFKLFYKKYFDFAWISGKPQFSYAQRFGFNMSTIINDLYCADTNSFVSYEKEIFASKRKRFLFVGRFVPEKGLDVLLKAYDMLDESKKATWNLHLIGSGSLESLITSKKSTFIKVFPYMQKEDLIKELRNGGVCIIPSRKDQWGLPVQEMALLGYPLIISSAVGSASEFLISGLNGYQFKSENANSLLKAMLKIISMDEMELSSFGEESVILGRRINSKQSAASFLSVLERDL